MKPLSKFLIAYGVFLILVGLGGYLSNPEKAKTALISGGTFGMFSLALGWLAWKNWRPAATVALGLAAFLGTVFLWRATVSWMAYAGGQSEKLVGAVLITSMLAATFALFTGLIRKRWLRSDSGANPSLPPPESKG